MQGVSKILAQIHYLSSVQQMFRLYMNLHTHECGGLMVKCMQARHDFFNICLNKGKQTLYLSLDFRDT